VATLLEDDFHIVALDPRSRRTSSRHSLDRHHLILDDPAGFSAAVERWLADTRKEDLK